ncbi:MAG: hypothetical protein KIT33_10340 [Candidatus Kapabacteria bacterium]|nr:hypothetical protein [Ignavibacteriota bacterium]MCW5885357.1 hypothetical protein [Candidatus Kapabacteria bacterium]
MKTTLKITTALLLVSSVFFAGCSNMMDNSPVGQNVGNFLMISPSDNSENIGINEPIVIEFAAPVDTKIIEDNFVLIGRYFASEASGEDCFNYDHSNMNSMMSNGTMMKHLKENHHTKGDFKWNSDKTRCEFKPDSDLEANTDYMMFVDSDMMNHMKSVMMNNGMMLRGMGMMSDCDCHNKGLDNTNIITHFRTRNN